VKATVLPGAIAIAVLTLVGCGRPTAQPAAPPPIPASPSESTAPLPPRPSELRLAGVDPCALLTEAQRAKIGVRTGVSSGDTDELGSPGCVWLNTADHPDNSWVAKTVTKRGAEYALGSVTGAKLVSVTGFPAVETTSNFADPQHECLLYVDVTDGQSLQVEYLNQSGDRPGINHDVACQLATAAASDMISTLKNNAR
jgi:Protein of unknown function (DUF3558)